MSHEHRLAAILAMGDELSLGQKLDTNSRWIAQQLVDRGIVPVEHVTVPDDLDLTAQTFRRLAERVDVIVSTGGLGPTADDLTRQALAAAAGDTLVEDLVALEQIKVWFHGRGRNMPELNRVQALRPSRATMLPNPNGTAPGIAGSIVAAGRVCDVFCLPGPPGEMTAMFESAVVPALRTATGKSVRIRIFQTIGLGESDVATRLGDLMARDRNPLVGTTASGGVISIRVRYEGRPEEADREIDRTVSLVRDRVGDIIFAESETTIAEAIVRELHRRNEKVLVVESCTGGMLGSMIADVPGASEVFVGGWITYSNEMKTREILVPPHFITEYGAVSRQVADAMAQGGLEKTDADHCLAITGVAGPGGGTPEKPVGTVWISLQFGTNPTTDTRRFKMTGSRAAIREWSARSALAMLWFHLAGKPQTSLLRQVEPPITV